MGLDGQDRGYGADPGPHGHGPAEHVLGRDQVAVEVDDVGQHPPCLAGGQPGFGVLGQGGGRDQDRGRLGPVGGRLQRAGERPGQPVVAGGGVDLGGAVAGQASRALQALVDEHGHRVAEVARLVSIS